MGEYDVAADFLTSSLFRFRMHKWLGDKALEQLDLEDLRWRPDAESNSIAIIVKHLRGNMLSRWTDFLTTDGEKPTRDRDGEFIDDNAGREEILRRWEEGWHCLLASLDNLNAEDLAGFVTVRGERMSVVDAILRQLGHVAYHVGQILWIGKARKGTAWKTLSVPRGKSKDFKLIRELSEFYRTRPA